MTGQERSGWLWWPQTLSNDWRLHNQVEHGYRFDQEQGIDVEDLQVHTLGHLRRLFALVLLAASFVFHVTRNWPP